MKKWLKVILIIFLVLVLLVAGIGIYVYYFHVFHTVRICISNEVEDVGAPCNSDKECVDMFIENVPQMKQMIEDSPKLMSDKFVEVLNEALFCETTCKFRNVYGDGFGSTVGEFESCKPGEKEVVQKIRGKESLELLKYVKENPDKFSLPY